MLEWVVIFVIAFVPFDLGFLGQMPFNILMRIIAGTHRSRRILAPCGRLLVRPITDRVKQSLFDRLWSLGLIGDNTAEESGGVADIFCGTGSLGLEALSRGAAYGTFVEKDRVTRGLLHENLKNLDLAKRATVVGADALAGLDPANPIASRPSRGHWTEKLKSDPGGTVQGRPNLGLIFVDPPYDLFRQAAARRRLEVLMAMLAPLAVHDGALILRGPDDTEAPLVDGWQEPDTQSTGSMALHLYRRAGFLATD